MTDLPLISIVIPAYNSAASLPATLATVLAQTEARWEALVVDDCSTDDPAAVVAQLGDPRIRVIRHERNGGASVARNTGIAAAKGRFVAFLDADDRWMPAKLEKQLAAVLASADPDRIFCVTQTVVELDENRSILRPIRPKRPDERMDEFIFVAAGFCQTSAFFVSTALARQVGGFRTLPTGEDHLFAIDLCAAGAEYLLIEEPLTVYDNRLRDGRLSQTTSLEQGARFMAGIADTVSRKAMLGYESRYLGVLALRRNPATGLALMVRAVRAGALSPRFALFLIARTLIPGALYHRIRARLLGT
jgi:glycosyltransferase involved in cell wall biosynthesis